MKIATGQSTDNDTVTACRAAYQQLEERLGSTPNIIYLAWSVAYKGEELLQELGKLAPECPIHGTTSCLGCMTEEGFISEQGRGLALLGISDPEGGYGVGGSEIDSSPRQAAIAALIAALEDSGRPGEIPSMVRLTAAPGAEEEVIAGIEEILGEKVPIIGGSAADNTVEGHWQLSANQSLFTNAVTISVLFPSTQTAFAFHSGYSPTSVQGRITRAERRVVHEIDGRPAAEVYNEWTKGAVSDALPAGGNVLSSTTLHPLGRVVGKVGGVPYYRLSHPDGVTADGSLTLFSDIAEGDELVLMTGSIDTLVTRAGRVAHTAVRAGELDKQHVCGAMIVYCAGCMLTVQNEMDRVVKELNDTLNGSPFLGTFTFGEQGCFIGGENRHGNLMISAMIFSD